MTLSPLMIFHVCAGIMGFLSGSGALLFRKGSRLHRASGKVFVVSMLSMAAAAVCLALVERS